MTTELQRARATASARQEAVQDALAAEHATALEQFANTGFAEGERWSLGDAYRRLFSGMDLEVEELLDHADAETLAAAEHARDATDQGRPVAFAVMARALYLDGFTDAAFLFQARLELAARRIGQLEEAVAAAATSRVELMVDESPLLGDALEAAARQDRQAPTDLYDVLGELVDYVAGEFTSPDARALVDRARELIDER